MKVSVKDLSVNMEIKNRAIVLDVYDNSGKYLGDLEINKSKLIWCKGKTASKNGVTISWDKFIEMMESR